MQCHWNTPVYHDGFLYGASGRYEQNSQFRCIELATGKVRWSVPGMTRLSMLMVDGHFIGLTEEVDLLLMKLDPQKCDMQSYLSLREGEVSDGKSAVTMRPPCWAAPILSHGLLYVRGGDKLICLELIPEKR
jgi:hypothetical protein